eukprot:3936112-Rhodomonas_salina.3
MRYGRTEQPMLIRYGSTEQPMLIRYGSTGHRVAQYLTSPAALLLLLFILSNVLVGACARSVPDIA